MRKFYLFVSIKTLIVKMVACVFLYIIYIYNIIPYVSVASKNLTLMTNLKYCAIVITYIIEKERKKRIKV